MRLTGLNFQMDAWADKLLLYQNSTSFKVRVLTLSFFSWGHHNLDYDFYNITINPHNLWIWIMFFRIFVVVVVVQSLSHVQLFVTPWTAACRAPLSFTISQDLLKLMSIELVMPSNHLSCVIPFSSCPQSFPASGPFPMSQFFSSVDQSIGVSASATVLPVNIQDWSPRYPRDSQKSFPAPQFESINSSALSFLYSPTPTSTHDY